MRTWQEQQLASWGQAGEKIVLAFLVVVLVVPWVLGCLWIGSLL